MDIVIRSFHSLLCVEITVGCWYSILRSNLIINLYFKMSKSFFQKQSSLYFNKIVLICKYLDISTHIIYAMFLHPLLFCVPLLGECCCVDIYVLRCCTLGIVVKNERMIKGDNCNAKIDRRFHIVQNLIQPNLNGIEQYQIETSRNWWLGRHRFTWLQTMLLFNNLFSISRNIKTSLGYKTNISN